MYNTISPEWKEISYMLYIPAKGIWFVQNVVETFQGVALMTSANMKEEEGEFIVLSNTDQADTLLSVIQELQKSFPSLRLAENL